VTSVRTEHIRRFVRRQVVAAAAATMRRVNALEPLGRSAARRARRRRAPERAHLKVRERGGQASAGLAHGQLGNLEEADRLSAGAVAEAAETDSLTAADAWEGRARVLAMLGRRSEMLEAAAKAHELHVAKGAVNFISRLDRFLQEQGVAPPPKS
jgi:hypothetical protein